ncbi:MAG: hypothetical protein ACJAYU_000703 [Bradymonadia bacterium]|jgi:hypothetical protein
MPRGRGAIQVNELDPIDKLHAQISGSAATLEVRHEALLQCRSGCSGCCVDELTVFDVEADRIRRDFPEVLREEAGPAGACAFLDSEGRCRVYAARPYVCRTQGLPIRWFAGDPVAEYRDICELNDTGLLTTFEPDECWLIGPTEHALAGLRRSDERVPLRSLFK